MTSLTELPLKDLLDRLIVDHEHGLASSTVECFFKPGISDFSKFLGRPAVISDLTRDVVNRWLQQKTEAGCALATIKTRRNAILGLWRYAYEAEIIDHEPKRVRKIRLAYVGVTTWTQEEVTQLIRSSFNGPDGYLGDTGLPKSLYFAAIISVAYDTALRLGDLLALAPSVIGIRNRRGHIRVIESKTGKLKQAILQSGATRQANNHHIIEAVSVDPTTGIPDGKHSLSMDIGGAANTTVTNMVYSVQNGGLVPIASAASASRVRIA